MHSMGGADMAPGSLESKRQLFVSIQPIDPLVIDFPAFSHEQNMNSAIAISDSSLRKIFDSGSENGLIIFDTLVAVC